MPDFMVGQFQLTQGYLYLDDFQPYGKSRPFPAAPSQANAARSARGRRRRLMA